MTTAINDLGQVCSPLWNYWNSKTDVFYVIDITWKYFDLISDI